jgi:hypothetical protein
MPASLLPQILELVWARAMPGREACCQNEILREVRELLQPRLPPRWFSCRGLGRS